MIKRLLAILAARCLAVPAGLAAARRACGEKGRGVDARKHYTAAPGEGEPRDREGDAFALDEAPGLRLS